MKTRMALASIVALALLTACPIAAPAAASPVAATAKLATDNVQEDFPAMCLDSDGTPWVAYVEWDGKAADTLKLAKKAGGALTCVATLAGPGVIHQPAVACDGKGAIHVIWSQLNADNVMDLHAQKIVGGKAQGKPVSLAGAPGNVFADAGTDRAGRVWVAWQSFRNGHGDIYARCYDPSAGTWGEEIQVTRHKEGDWEPRLAFGAEGAAIVFDSSRNGNFDVFLAQVSAAGKVGLKQLTKAATYEARATIAATPDGKGYWVAWEKGSAGWGKDTRGVGGGGLNSTKTIEAGYLDAASGQFTPAADTMAALRTAGAGPAKPAAPAKPGKPAKKPKGGGGVGAVNLPEVGVDGQGNCWLACRFYKGAWWRIAVTRYDAKQKVWTQPATLADSAFAQDRRCQASRDGEGSLWLAWPSDLRTSKKPLTSGVYLAKIDPAATLATAAPKAAAAKAGAAGEAAAKFGGDTPERTRADRSEWTVNGKTYRLYFGDFHRHTDVSNCRTDTDGCIVEQFRYAYDMGKLDYLGTSDHTDIGKAYSPYEWWCSQKLHDVFMNPGFLMSFYVYEREQKWPWGHRNVVFIERGGPLIYIKRALYKSMPWHKTLPAPDGEAEITPHELWKMLRQNGMDVTVIGHTGATGMGTDWDKYGTVDNAVENVVEIYQGARVSYEGIGAPQPQVGFPVGKKLEADAHGSVQTGKDFGKYNKGVWQNALKNGYKLGAFASSDHISANTSFGGVYAESFTRKAILDGINARRTLGATDKIFAHFTCNGHPMGEVFETAEKPTIAFSVEGTADLKAVTVVRNEMNVQRFTPESGAKLSKTFTDPAPIKGENRYYLRVEQKDGNMAWTSPVWVTYKK